MSRWRSWGLWVGERVQSTFWADVGQLDTPGGDELECLGNILRFLHPHAGVPVISTKGGITCEQMPP